MRNLNHYRKNIYSQNGEDGILDFLCSKLELKNGWCVEFGAWDGMHLSNTRSLIEKGWQAVLIEGDKERFKDLQRTYRDRPDIYTICAYVGFADGDPDDLHGLLKRTPIPKNFDILSIDVDGNDFFIWEKFQEYEPAIVVIESNSFYKPDEKFVGEKNSGQGASAASLVELGKAKGYQIVAHTGNCIFVKDSLYNRIGIDNNDLRYIFDNKWVDKNKFMTKMIVSPITKFVHKIKIQLGLSVRK